MGAVIAGWADEGLHPETFWAGYATGTAVAWHVAKPDPRILLDSFFNLFYGSRATLMAQVYQLMSEEAQFWADSWEWAPSSARKPIFGNSDRVFDPPKSAQDQTLSLPPVPAPSTLSVDLEWKKDNDRRLQLVFKYMLDNGELKDLLKKNLGRVKLNRYNLEVLASVAEIYEQNLWMILDLGRINTLLNSADVAVKKKRPQDAVAALDHALDLAENIRQRRNLTLRQVTATWYKTWYPRVEAANGRRFVHVLDDVKDHLPDLTVRCGCRLAIGSKKWIWFETTLRGKTVCPRAKIISTGWIRRPWCPREWARGWIEVTADQPLGTGMQPLDSRRPLFGVGVHG